MKRIISFILICLPICASAQLPELKALSTEYELTKDVTVAHLEGDMLKAAFDNNADNITSIDALVSENAAVTPEIFDKAAAIMSRYDMEPIVKTKTDDVDVLIYTTKAQGVITDIIVIVEKGETCVVSVISGNIPEEELTNFVQVAM